jgi:hypothetical protein
VQPERALALSTSTHTPRYMRYTVTRPARNAAIPEGETQTGWEGAPPGGLPILPEYSTTLGLQGAPDVRPSTAVRYSFGGANACLVFRRWD